MRSRSGRTWVRTVVALSGVLCVGASLGVLPAAAAKSNPLGPVHRAKGTPVKIGVISNGRTSSLDNTDEGRVAEATVQWINDYRGGLGGHPIELVLCEDESLPGKAVDCANEMISQDVAAVVIGANGVAETSWRVLNGAGIPYFAYGVAVPDMLADASSTFNLGNPEAALLGLPAGVAKKAKAKKVTAIVIDVPAATDLFKNGDEYFADRKLDYEVVTVPPGTADMTPQMQRVVSSNPDGVAMVVGNDAFCIAAFNGLRTAGYEGDITTVSQCITDATRTAVPGDTLKGVQISTFAPLADTKDPSIKQYYAVLDKYGAEIDRSATTGVQMFNSLGAFSVATDGLEGEVTPESVIQAIKTMPWSVAPGSGGLHFRCNGKANPAQPAVCSLAINGTRLDATGKPAKYTAVGDTPIPG